MTGPIPVQREPQSQQRSLSHVTRPAALSRTPNAVALLVALRRRWLLALSLGLVLAPAAAGTTWALRPVTYTARTLLEVKSSPNVILYRLPERDDFSSYQRSQVALVKSRLVLNTALRKVENLPLVIKQEDPLLWLEKEIHADFSIAPEVMRIYMTGQDSQALVVLVDAVRRAYLDEIVQKESRARNARLTKLKEYYADYDAKLREKRQTLRDMVHRVGTKNEKVLGAKQELNDKYLRDLESELLKRRSEMRTASLELARQEARTNSSADATVPEALIEQTVKQDPVVAEFQKKITQHEVLIAQFRDRSPNPEAEPGYKSLMQAVAAANAGIAKRREQLRPEIVKQMRGKVQDDNEQMRIQLADRVQFLKEIDEQLGAEIARFSKDIKVFNEDSAEVGWLNDEIAQLDSVNKEITKQMQALEVEMQAPSRMSELEEAVPLPAQTEASRLRFAGGAGAGVFALALLSVAFLEFLRRRVNHSDDISEGLKLKLVGSLPFVPRRALLGRASSAQNVQWQNRLMESVDAIRTTLLSAAKFDGLRRVMVTSAVGGEGKTLLSCHLAVSLARAGYRTLLIDGDLRRPSVHRLFNTPLGQGLSDLLRGDAEPPAVLRSGPLDKLSILTAGQSDSRAIQLLARDRVVETLQQLSEGYDFVVVDSAPVLPIADAQLIGQHVDGVVLSVMRDVSRLPAVYAAYERLAQLRVRILGAVVSGTDSAYYRSSYYSNSTPAVAEPPLAEKASA